MHSRALKRSVCWADVKLKLFTFFLILVRSSFIILFPALLSGGVANYFVLFSFVPRLHSQILLYFIGASFCGLSLSNC